MTNEKEETKILIELLKNPVFLLSMTIVAIVSTGLYFTQDSWLNYGIEITQGKYQVGDEYPTTSPFILSGYYQDGVLYNIDKGRSVNLNMMNIECNKNGEALFFVINPENVGIININISLSTSLKVSKNSTEVSNIRVMRILKGCK